MRAIAVCFDRVVDGLPDAYARKAELWVEGQLMIQEATYGELSRILLASGWVESIGGTPDLARLSFLIDRMAGGEWNVLYWMVWSRGNTPDEPGGLPGGDRRTTEVVEYIHLSKVAS